MERLKEIISIYTYKGGALKTSMTTYIAQALRQLDASLRILVIDLDTQCCLTRLQGIEDTSDLQTVYDALSRLTGIPVYDIYIKGTREDGDGGIFICPASPDLVYIDRELQRRMQPKAVLRKCFSKPIINHSSADLPDDITEAFDYIFIDCPPALSDIIYNSMSVADSVLIPVQPEQLSIDALAKTKEACAIYAEEMNPDLKVRGIVLSMIDNRTSACRVLSDKIVKENEGLMFNTHIRRCTKVIEAQAVGRDLFDYAPSCSVANDYINLAQELFNLKPITQNL